MLLDQRAMAAEIGFGDPARRSSATRGVVQTDRVECRFPNWAFRRNKQSCSCLKMSFCFLKTTYSFPKQALRFLMKAIRFLERACLLLPMEFLFLKQE